MTTEQDPPRADARRAALNEVFDRIAARRDAYEESTRLNGHSIAREARVSECEALMAMLVGMGAAKDASAPGGADRAR